MLLLLYSCTCRQIAITQSWHIDSREREQERGTYRCIQTFVVYSRKKLPERERKTKFVFDVITLYLNLSSEKYFCYGLPFFDVRTTKTTKIKTLNRFDSLLIINGLRQKKDDVHSQGRSMLICFLHEQSKIWWINHCSRSISLRIQKNICSTYLVILVRMLIRALESLLLRH